MTTQTLNDGPAVHEWTGPTGVKFRDVRETSGTYYHDTTPRAVVDALEKARESGARVRLWIGDRETGANWFDEWHVSGTVGRSMGPIKIPLLISSTRSHGGPAILCDCIVCLQVNGCEVYRHPKFSMPGYSIRLSADPKLAQCPWECELTEGESSHLARFKTKLSAQRYAQFMRGERAAK